LPLLGWQLLASFPRLMICALTPGTKGVSAVQLMTFQGRIST